MQAFIDTLNFDMGMGAIITMNCVLIGMQATEKNNRNAIWYEVVEYLLSFIFVAEWVCRVMVNGWLWLTELGNLADSFIVWSGIVALFVPLFYPDLGIQVLRKLSSLRALRLVRLAQAVRFFLCFF